MRGGGRSHPDKHSVWFRGLLYGGYRYSARRPPEMVAALARSETNKLEDNSILKSQTAAVLTKLDHSQLSIGAAV